MKHYQPSDGPLVSVREALREGLRQSMLQDSSVFLMGEEVAEYQGAYKISKGLLDEFGPQRVIDSPISEYGFAGLGVGAAFMGLKPVIEFMSFNFSMQAIDHIINSAAKTYYMSGGMIQSPIVFRGPNGMAAGVGAQHSQCFASWYMHCPGLKVVCPYDSASAKGLLEASIQDPNPVVFLEHELMYGKSFPMPEVMDPWPLGKALIRKEGLHVTVVSFSFSLDLCLKAAEILEGEGISLEVIDLCSLRPLDTQTVVESVSKTHRMIVVEEGWPVCGVGSEISAYIGQHAFDQLDAPIMRLAGRDIPLPYAQNLEAACVPQVQDLIDCVRTLCQGAF